MIVSAMLFFLSLSSLVVPVMLIRLITTEINGIPCKAAHSLLRPAPVMPEASTVELVTSAPASSTNNNNNGLRKRIRGAMVSALIHS